MRKQKALGVNALEEEVEAIDKRRKELGLSRAKYLTTLAKLDIEHELLVAGFGDDDRPVIDLQDANKPIVRITKKDLDAWGDKIVNKAYNRLIHQNLIGQSGKVPLKRQKGSSE